MTDVTHESEVGDHRLCSNCIGEVLLRGVVKQSGEERACDYCENNGTTMAIAEFAEYIETAFEQHFQRTATEPSSL